jgi:hypothetical protein
LDDFTRQRRQLDERLSRKENELEIVRHELNQVKEFRKKKGQMQEELEEVNILFISYFIDLLFNFQDKRSNGLEST